MGRLRLVLLLELNELQALVQMAQRECRHPRDQMRFLLREEACRRNLLTLEVPEASLSEGPSCILEPPQWTGRSKSKRRDELCNGPAKR